MLCSTHRSDYHIISWPFLKLCYFLPLQKRYNLVWNISTDSVDNYESVFTAETHPSIQSRNVEYQSQSNPQSFTIFGPVTIYFKEIQHEKS